MVLTSIARGKAREVFPGLARQPETVPGGGPGVAPVSFSRWQPTAVLTID